MSERALERPHLRGEDPLWCESWYVDFADPSGRGGFLRLALVPGDRRAWVWAGYASPEGTVQVRDHDVPLPKATALEVRSTGLWADLVCETAMTHWSFGLEAFGVALEDPADAYRGERGDRVPLGFDLEWEAMAPPFEHPGAAAKPATGHYQHPGHVHGEVLVGDATVSIDGMGERDHFWGVRDWWGVGWHWAAFRLAEGKLAVSIARPDLPGSEHATGYVTVEGEDPHPILRADIETERGDEGIPTGVVYRLENGLEVVGEVISPVPLVVPHAAGSPISRLPRVLCRFSSSEGAGWGWAEWLQTG